MCLSGYLINIFSYQIPIKIFAFWGGEGGGEEGAGGKRKKEGLKVNFSEALFAFSHLEQSLLYSSEYSHYH